MQCKNVGISMKRIEFRDEKTASINRKPVLTASQETREKNTMQCRVFQINF